MKTIQLLLISGFIFLTACSRPIGSELDSGHNFAGIIGGEEVSDKHKFGSSIVAVYDAYNRSMCTGSLLKDNLVLTAAHCIKPDSDLIIIFAKNTTSTRDPSIKIHVSEVDRLEVTPNWIATGGVGIDRGDMALLHYVGETPSEYKPVHLLTSDHSLKRADKVVVAGYGVSHVRENKGTGILRTAEVHIEDSEYGTTEVVLDQSVGRGACHGDSGGPAFIKVSDKYFLWGVTSRGLNDNEDNCSESSVFTNVQKFSQWILDASERLRAEKVNPVDSSAAVAPL